MVEPFLFSRFSAVILIFSNQSLTDPVASHIHTGFSEENVICRPGGPYWEKLCKRSWGRSEAAGRGPNSRLRAQFFPIRADLRRQITCLFFSSVKHFLIRFSVEFSLQPFSNLVYTCVWHLGNRKSTLQSFAFICFLGHYLHFTFFAFKKKKQNKTKTPGKDAKAGKLVAVRTQGPDGKIQTAGVREISQSDSRI